MSKNPPSIWPENASLPEIKGEWKVAHLKPRQEKALARDLVEAGIPYCCPFYLNVVRRRDNNKPRKSILPVFSGYLAFAETGNNASTVWRTDRVVRILPVVNQEGLVQELSWVLMACADGKPIRPLNAQSFQKGERVRIAAGPMRGFNGEIAKIDGHNHVILTVGMFNQSVAIQIDQSYLSKAD